MSHPFSTKGTIGRIKLLAYLLLVTFSPIFGLLAARVIGLLTSPLGAPATGYFWSEASAAFVAKYLSWVSEGWHPAFAMVGFYLVAQRAFDCAYIKCARAIGIEIENTWLVPSYFLGFQKGATLKDLLLTPRRHRSQKNTSA